MSLRVFRSMAGLLALAGAISCAPALAGAISGTVTYEGKVPQLKPVAMAADPGCAMKHKEPVPNEVLVLGSGNTMANILVQVTKGLPAGKSYPPPAGPAVIDQRGCQYIPHVIGIRVGQQVKFLNSDGILHNVHALPKTNKPFNVAMPPERKEAVETFSKAEGMFLIKCDVHPWMGAYAAVLPHPFFFVTQKDGKFTISGLDPGTYEIEAWHEKLGTRTATVTIAGSETKTVDLKFSPPPPAK